jgi:hypothetical protein
VRRASPAPVRVPHDDRWDSIHNIWWRTPPLFAFSRSGVDLHQLDEINPIRKPYVHRLDVGLEAVRRKLERRAAICGLFENESPDFIALNVLDLDVAKRPEMASPRHSFPQFEAFPCGIYFGFPPPKWGLRQMPHGACRRRPLFS